MKRLMLSTLFAFCFVLSANAQLTVTYTEEKPGSIIATVKDADGKDAWPGGHYLNAEEQALLKTDQEILDAQIVTLVPKPAPTPAPQEAPRPVELRKSDPIAAADAQSLLETYKTLKSQVSEGIALLLKRAEGLPIAKQAEILSQVQATVDAELIKISK